MTHINIYTPPRAPGANIQTNKKSQLGERSLGSPGPGFGTPVMCVYIYIYIYMTKIYGCATCALDSLDSITVRST